MSEAYWASLVSVLQVMMGLFLISGLGFGLTRFGLFRKDDAKTLSRVLIDLVVPAKLFVATAAGLTGETINECAVVILVVVIMILAGMGWARIGSTVLRDSDSRTRRALVPLTAIQNAMYIPLSLAPALVPPELSNRVTVYVGGAILPTFLLQWTFGVYLLRSRGEGPPAGIASSLRNAITPPPVGMIAGAVCAFVSPLALAARGEGGPIAAVLVFDACHLLGMALAPLAMLILGMLIANCSFKKLRPGVLVIPFSYRLLAAPALMLLALNTPVLNWVTAPLALVLMVEAASPPATSLSIIAVRYDGDWETVSAVLLATYLSALVTMPAWVAVVMPG